MILIENLGFFWYRVSSSAEIHRVVQVSLKILLPQPLKDWDTNCAILCTDCDRWVKFHFLRFKWSLSLTQSVPIWRGCPTSKDPPILRSQHLGYCHNSILLEIQIHLILAQKTFYWLSHIPRPMNKFFERNKLVNFT